MKKKLLAFLLMLTVVASLGMAQGKWRLNPYTGKLDYYEPKAGLATLASPSFTGTVKSAGPLEVGPVGRNLKTWWNFEDFVSQSQPTVYVLGIWVINITGDATVSNIAATALRPGIRKLATGTGTTNIASISTGGIWYPVQFLFGGGVYTIEGDINIPVLSSATETYALRFGFGDVYNGDFVDGAYFEYYDVGGATPTPDWYKCTASNSTRTKTDTTIVATAGATTWNRLKIVVNADASSVEYFINGVSAGVVTTNIPSGTGRGTGAVFHIVKSAGTTDRQVDVDWIWLHIDLATSR